MTIIHPSEVEIFTTSSGDKTWVVNCPICNHPNHCFWPPGELKSLICDNKKCREYLKIAEEK